MRFAHVFNVRERQEVGREVQHQRDVAVGFE